MVMTHADSFKKFTNEPALVCLPPSEDDNDEKEKAESEDPAESNTKRQTLWRNECLAPGDDIEILLNHDPSTPMKNVASILEGFIDDPSIEENNDLFDLEFPTYIEEGYYDSEGDVIYLESLLSDDTTHNLSPNVFFDHEPQHIENESGYDTFSPKSDPLHHEFIGSSPENFCTIIESLPTSTTLVEDSDSNREEIDIFSGPNDSIPQGNYSNFDSEEDIIDNLLNNDPMPEYERLTFDMEPDVSMINNVDDLNENECFDPRGGEINVEVDDSFTFVIRTFLMYLTYPEVSPLLSSTKNEDKPF
ncbi:hypothetical protein Tco_0344281 [Tanacetum coccineum]